MSTRHQDVHMIIYPIPNSFLIITYVIVHPSSLRRIQNLDGYFSCLAKLLSFILLFTVG